MIIKWLLTSIFVAPGTANIVDYIEKSEITGKATQDLESLIDNDLGEITDTSKKQIDSLLEAKYNIDTAEINYEILGYDGAKIVAKNDSKKYSGYKYVTYSTKLSFKLSESNSKNLNVHAYNSTQYDSDEIFIEYEPNLGKEMFVDYFKNIEFEWWARTYDNGRKGNGGYRGHNQTNLKGEVLENEDGVVSYTKKTFSLTSNELRKTELYSRVYNKTNYVKSYGYFKYVWTDNKLQMTFEVYSESYATAWNAYWADGNNQLFIQNLIFTI